MKDLILSSVVILLGLVWAGVVNIVLWVVFGIGDDYWLLSLGVTAVVIAAALAWMKRHGPWPVILLQVGGLLGLYAVLPA